jgi:hypothetical protein
MGFVVYNPLQGYNDLVSGAYSTNAYTGTTIQANGIGIVALTDAQLPFASTGPRSNRVVGAGLRIRYTGTELKKAGSQVSAMYGTSSTEDLVGYNYAQLASRPDCEPTPVSRGWRAVSWLPTDDSFSEFIPLATGIYGSLTSNVGTRRMGFLFQGETGSQYEFEIVSFREYISTNEHLVPGLTASHSDMNGMGAIRNFLGSVWNSEPGQNLYNRGVDYVYNYLTGASASVLQSISTASPLLLTL